MRSCEESAMRLLCGLAYPHPETDYMLVPVLIGGRACADRMSAQVRASVGEWQCGRGVWYLGVSCVRQRLLVSPACASIHLLLRGRTRADRDAVFWSIAGHREMGEYACALYSVHAHSRVCMLKSTCGCKREYESGRVQGGNVKVSHRCANCVLPNGRACSMLLVLSKADIPFNGL